MSIDRKFLGGCRVAKLTAGLGGTDADRVLTVNTLAGWDFTVGEVFEVSVNRNTPGEEKMLCTIGSRSPDGSGTLTVWTEPGTGKVHRAWDDTPISKHDVDSRVEHVFTATDAREALTAAHALEKAPAHVHGTWRDILQATAGP